MSINIFQKTPSILMVIRVYKLRLQVLLTPSEQTKFIELDHRLVDAAKGIKILSSLGWGARHLEVFLKDLAKKNPKLPVVDYTPQDLSGPKAALKKVINECDQSHPIGKYIAETAASYVLAANMLESVGTSDFTAMSQLLYGRPTDKLGNFSNLQLAEDFVKITSDFAAAEHDNSDEERIYTPEEVAKILKTKADEFFLNDQIAVVIDPNLSAKAAAGAERVRIRSLASFTRSEIDQLFEHELLVHTASMLNGRKQPMLKSLGLGAPRTTGTQEGIATFAELITATMDLMRLRRIALRIKAIQMAMDGGDFIDIFRYFQNAGQSDRESFQSAARVFRGGDVRGKVAFTKDVVYLKGLFSVHTFLRKAIEQRRITYPQLLFIGRVTLGDVISLGEFVSNGSISAPHYLPRWAANRDGLAAYLSYSVLTHSHNFAEIKLEDFHDDPLTDHPILRNAS